MCVDPTALRRYGIKEYDLVDKLPDTADELSFCVLTTGTDSQVFRFYNGRWEEVTFVAPPKRLTILGHCPSCGNLMAGFECEYCGEKFL